MGRFRDVRRGARLNEALTNYQAYLARSVSTALPNYKAKANPIALQITPFGFDLPTGSFARVNGNEGWATVNGMAGVTNATTVAPAGANANQIRGFRPARVTWFRSTTKSVTNEQSRYTLQTYRKYTGDRFSMPFGQRADTDREFEVADKIKTALKSDPAYVISRVSITPEMMRSN